MPRSLKYFLRLGGLGLLGAMASCSDSVVAPSLNAACAATPGSGRAPLTVSFSLNVDGAQGAMSVVINYGDGAAGAEVNAPHTYANAGSYTATFNVSTPTQSALCSVVVGVDAAPQPTPTPEATNHQPVVVFNTNPDPDASDTFRSGPPLTVAFNVCKSSDPDGDDLNYRLDLDGDGVFEVDGPTGSDCRRTHTYTKVGTFVARVCVTDLLPNLSLAHPYQCRNYVVHIE